MPCLLELDFTPWSDAAADEDRQPLRSIRCRRFERHLSLEERKQVCIDLVRVGCAHPVRKTGIDLQRGILYELCGHQRRRADRYDLVIVAMKDQGRHIEFLQVFREVGLGESLDTIV